MPSEATQAPAPPPHADAAARGESHRAQRARPRGFAPILDRDHGVPRGRRAQAHPGAAPAEDAVLQRGRPPWRGDPSRSRPGRAARRRRRRRRGPRAMGPDAEPGRAQPRRHRLVGSRVLARPARVSQEQGGAVPPPGEPRHDPQCLHRRPGWSWHRGAVRAAARGVGARHRRGPEPRRTAPDRGRGVAGRPDGQPRLRGDRQPPPASVRVCGAPSPPGRGLGAIARRPADRTLRSAPLTLLCPEGRTENRSPRCQPGPLGRERGQRGGRSSASAKRRYASRGSPYLRCPAVCCAQASRSRSRSVADVRP